MKVWNLLFGLVAVGQKTVELEEVVFVLAGIVACNETNCNRIYFLVRRRERESLSFLG
jgi:hypothetical protein